MIGWRSTPSQPKWSTMSAIASWPAIVDGGEPAAPSARTVQTIEATYSAPIRPPPTSAHQGASPTFAIPPSPPATTLTASSAASPTQ